RVRSRGAANDSFELLFLLPFGKRFADTFKPAPVALDADSGAMGRPVPWRTYAAGGLVALSAAGAVAGVLTLRSAHDLKTSAPPGASQADVAALNDRVRGRNLAAGVELTAAGA